MEPRGVIGAWKLKNASLFTDWPAGARANTAEYRSSTGEAPGDARASGEAILRVSAGRWAGRRGRPCHRTWRRQLMRSFGRRGVILVVINGGVGCGKEELC